MLRRPGSQPSRSRTKTAPHQIGAANRNNVQSIHPSQSNTQPYHGEPMIAYLTHFLAFNAGLLMMALFSATKRES